MKKFNINRWIPIVCCWLAMGCGQSDGYESDLKGYYEATYNGNVTSDESSSGKYEEFADNPFVNVADQPVSTFSVDADGASYAIMRRTVREAFYRIDPSSVRIEEFLNYFTFDYPEPEDGQSVAINAEVGECPWNKEHRLVRLGIKGKKMKKDEVPQANFVFLIDVSGSMNGSDRLDMLKAGLIELLGQLNPQDRISIVTYSGSVRKLLESTPVSEASKIKNAISKLSAFLVALFFMLSSSKMIK